MIKITSLGELLYASVALIVELMLNFIKTSTNARFFQLYRASHIYATALIQSHRKLMTRSSVRNPLGLKFTRLKINSYL